MPVMHDKKKHRSLKIISSGLFTPVDMGCFLELLVYYLRGIHTRWRGVFPWAAGYYLKGIHTVDVGCFPELLVYYLRGIHTRWRGVFPWAAGYYLRGIHTRWRGVFPWAAGYYLRGIHTRWRGVFPWAAGILHQRHSRHTQRLCTLTFKMQFIGECGGTPYIGLTHISKWQMTTFPAPKPS